MDTYLARLSKATLATLPETERVLLFSFAHFANELRALEKAIVWSMNTSSLGDHEINGQVSLEFMYLKLLAGKLNEANKLIQQKLFGTVAGRELVVLLPRKAKKALDRINRHFSSTSTVNLIRNLDAFHYRTADIDLALVDVPEDMELYVQEISLNNLTTSPKFSQ